MTNFQEPIDVPDAQWRADVLEEEIARVKQQLADPKRKFERGSGRPLSEVDYQAWRAKAEDALYHKRRELGYLTAWLQRKGIVVTKPEPTQELIVALEVAMPLILSEFQPLKSHFEIDRLVEAFGFVTGAYGNG